MNKTETLERLEELKLSLINQRGEISLWNTLIGVLTDMHVEELKETETGIDWKAECANITKQHDQVLNKIKILEKKLNSNDQEFEELKLKESKIKLQHESALVIIQAMSNEIDRLKSLDQYNERNIKELEKSKCVGKLHVEVNLSQLPSSSEYVKEYQIMKEQIEFLNLQVKRFKDKYQRSNKKENELNIKYNELVELYDIRMDELEKYKKNHKTQVLFNCDLVKRNDNLQHLAQIGRVINWAIKKNIEFIDWGNEKSFIELNAFDMKRLEKLYRKDPQNEAF